MVYRFVEHLKTGSRRPTLPIDKGGENTVFPAGEPPEEDLHADEELSPTEEVDARRSVSRRARRGTAGNPWSNSRFFFRSCCY
jgi:hypothetical protein